MYKMHFGEIKGISLDGDWGLLPDPMGRCTRQKWWMSVRKEGYFFPSYDDHAFWPTRVPGSYNAIHPNLEFYEGEVIYMKKFDARVPENHEKVFLHFGAVADRCYVFLNGDYMGEHDGSHTAFTFDITAAIKEQNRLLIIVDTKKEEDGVPGVIHDWFHFGGIHRSVSIYYRPEVYVRDAAITTSIHTHHVSLEIEVLVEAYARGKKEKVSFEILDTHTGENLITDEMECQTGKWCGKTIILPKEKVNLWNTEQPFLYKVSISVGRDVWEDTFGIREVKVDGKSILLNGEPITLLGAAAWTQDPERGIFSLGCEMSAKTVEILKDLNCNFARAGHCPPSKEFVKECDRRGILLWMEVPAYWIDDMQKPTQSRRALKALEEMIREHRNSPSIIFWSIGNECIRHNLKEPRSNLGYFVEAADFVHEMDPSRLVTYTSGLEGVVRDSEELLELLYPKQLIERLDVLAINSYSGIHEQVSADEKDRFLYQYQKIEKMATFQKPLILAEAGIDAVLHEKSLDFGEQRQVVYHEKLQELLVRCTDEGSLQGICCFALCDFRTPIKLGVYQGGYNRKGILTEKLEPKPAYYVVQQGYARKESKGKE